MSSYSAMQFLCAPILGRLSDRVGRRPVLLVSLAGTVVGYLLFAFAKSLPMLFLARLLDGATGGNVATAQAVIADVTSEKDRARGMGLVGMAFGLGFILGPALGGFAIHWGDAAPGLAAAALSAAAFFWALVALPETRPEVSRTGPAPSLFASRFPFVRSEATRGHEPLLLAALVATTAFASFEATFAQHVRARFGLSPSGVAWLFVVLGASTAVVQGLLVRRLVPVHGERRLMAAGATLLGCGFVALALATARAGLLAAVVAMATGTGLLVPSLSGLLSRRTARERQGEVLGAFQSMSSLGRVLGPFVGENLFLRVGPSAAYGLGLALEAVVLRLVLSPSARENPPVPPSSPASP